MKRWNWVLLASVLIAVVAVYGTILNAPPLTWDDDSNIFANPYFTLHRWWGVWSEPYFGLYVPITSSIWAGLLAIGAGATWPFRVLNLTLHLANSAMVYGLLLALARRWTLKFPLGPALGAALFALHPMQVETVAWISGGRDLLAAFFCLGALCVSLRDTSRRGHWLATGLFALALLSKPSVVTFPIVVGLTEWWFLQRSVRSVIGRMAPWLLMSLLAAMITHGAQLGLWGPEIPLWLKPWLIADTYSFYIQKTLWPFPLVANYGRTPEVVLSHPWELWKALLGVATMAGVAQWAYWHDRRYAIGLAWLILLLPVSGLVPFAYQVISGVADHYHYLPLAVVAGLFMLVVEPLAQMKKIWCVPVVALIGLWSAVSFARAQVWRSEEAFFKDMATQTPNSYNTAIGMSVVACQDLKDYPEGVRWTEKALEIRPNDILALANRAYCLLQDGKRAQVIEMEFYVDRIDLDQLAETQPTGLSSLFASIGTALIQENQFDEGYQFLCEAYRIKPTEANHAHNLEVAGNILKQNGLNPVCEEDNREEGDVDNPLDSMGD